LLAKKYLLMRCVRYSVFLRKGKGFWEGKSLKIVVARFFLFSRIANKLNCIFATLKSINQFGMYAIVEIAGQQFKVSKDLKVYVHRLTNEEGTTVSFRQSLFVRRQWRNHNRRP
jgi:hypothetical protein